MMECYGDLVDSQSRCRHYHGERDILALKCFSCQKYYACYHCHDECEEHGFKAYPLALHDKVVLCGVCKSGLTFEEYQVSLSCPTCHSEFNPSCQAHYDIYFER